MTMMILKNIDSYIAKVKSWLKSLFENKSNTKLIIVEVGENAKEMAFHNLLEKYSKQIGVNVNIYWFPEDIEQDELFREIEDLQEFCTGFVLQTDLPDHLDANILAAAIRPNKDICGLRKDSDFESPMAIGIINYLDYCDCCYEGKDIVIIGRGQRVGKPLSAMLIDKHATVTVCHSKSKLPPHIYHCDLIVCATGNEKVLDCAGVNVPVIEVGRNGSCYNVKNKDIVTVTDSVMATAILKNLARSVED